MKPTLRRLTLAALLASAALPLPLAAQTAAPAAPGAVAAVAVPPALAGYANVTRMADVGGLQAWAIPGQDFLWLLAPDGSTLVAGYAFAANGVDLNATIFGLEPLNLPEFMALNSQAPIGAAVADVGLGQIFMPMNQVEPSDAAPMSGLEMLGAVQAQNLDSLPEHIRSEVLARLVEALRSAQTEEEFRTIMTAWRAYAASVMAGGPVSAPFPEVAFTPQAQAPATPLAPAAPVQPETGMTALPEPAVMGAQTGSAQQPEAPAAEPPAVGQPDATAQPAILPQETAAAPAADDNSTATLLDDTRRNTMWFSVGASTAPVVYAYIDPSCPFCARAMKTLQPEIESGSLQLRIILAPLISTNSPGLIAGILAMPNPVEGFLQHELAVAEQRTSPVTPREFAALPENLAEGIRRNYDMVMKYELPGVPFFVYDTSEGPAYLSGVPNAGQFAAALPDAFTGSN